MVKIFKNLKIKEKFGGIGGGNTNQSVSTQALIPYDADRVPIFTDCAEEAMYMKNTKGKKK